jgi:hypothetical protein
MIGQTNKIDGKAIREKEGNKVKVRKVTMEREKIIFPVICDVLCKSWKANITGKNCI